MTSMRALDLLYQMEISVDLSISAILLPAASPLDQCFSTGIHKLFCGAPQDIAAGQQVKNHTNGDATA